MAKPSVKLVQKKDWKLQLCSTAGIILSIPAFLMLIIAIPMTAYALYLNIVNKHEKEEKTKKVIATLFLLVFLIVGVVATVWVFFHKPDLFCTLLILNIVLSILSMIFTFPKKDRTKKNEN